MANEKKQISSIPAKTAGVIKKSLPVNITTSQAEGGKKDILAILVEKKIIKPEQTADIQAKVKKDKKSIEDVLIDQKIIDIEKLTEIKAETKEMPYVNLAEKQIPKEVLEIITPEVAKNYKIICFNKAGPILEMGVVDPSNLKAREALNFFAKESGYSIKYHLISEASFNKAIKQYSSLSEEVDIALKAREEEEQIKELEHGEKQGKTEEISKAAPVSKIVSVILRHAVDGHASDIHIEPYQNESRIRYRVDGILHTSLTLPRSVHDAVVARIKVLASLKLDETRLPQDGRIRLEINGKRIDFRVSIMPLVTTEKVVMRILDVSKGAPKLPDLGYEGRNLKVIDTNVKKTDGLFLVTGPTGSGKSTTIFSILNIINKEGVNISTLEDPVEYFLEGANQAQIRSQIGFSFATGLRSLLRQDPDIIMVGEIRDNETAELAIHAALTGHMVLSTLHTNDAVGTIPRLMDMKVEPFLLSSTLNGIVAQRLLRRICEYCKIEEEMSEDVYKDVLVEVKKAYDLVGDEVKKVFDSTILNKEKERVSYKGKGCSRCGNSGYSGRLSIAEVLEVNDEVSNYIANKKEIAYDSDLLKKQKFITIKQDGIIRALQGITSMEEVFRVMSD